MKLIINPNAAHELESSLFPDVCTVKETQRILGVGRVSVYHLIEAGQLQAFRIGRAYKIPKKCITEFLEGRMKNQ